MGDPKCVDAVDPPLKNDTAEDDEVVCVKKEIPYPLERRNKVQGQRSNTANVKSKCQRAALPQNA
jgi:hypothetical protein